MSSQPKLQDQLNTKKVQLEVTVQKILSIGQNIHQLTQIFHTEAAKLQAKITKVQFSRPRGNPDQGKKRGQSQEKYGSFKTNFRSQPCHSRLPKTDPLQFTK